MATKQQVREQITKVIQEGILTKVLPYQSINGEFDCSIFNLFADLSTARISALSFASSARWVDLLPGAAQASKIFSPSFGFKRGAIH